MLNLVLFGPPGAGKGTQAKFLVDKFDLEHISTGELLRAEIAAGTELGKLAKETIDKGQLCPDHVVIGILERTLDECSDCKGFLFDGFPRTVAQAEAMDRLFKERNLPFSGMLSLEVKRDELMARLLDRGKYSGRSDDNKTIIENRIKIYDSITTPIIDYYKPLGKYFGINGMGEVSEIASRLEQVVLSLKDVVVK